jgi:hypothetical protein
MDSVLLAHSVEGVPAGTVVIFGGKLSVILDVGEHRQAENEVLYCHAKSDVTLRGPMTKPFDHQVNVGRLSNIRQDHKITLDY